MFSHSTFSLIFSSEDASEHPVYEDVAGFGFHRKWLETIALIQCDHGHTFSAIVTNVLLGHIGLALVTPAWFGHKAAFLKSP